MNNQTRMPVRSAVLRTWPTMSNHSSVKNTGVISALSKEKRITSYMPLDRRSASWRSTSSGVTGPFQYQ
ncbi:hypothetical protein [Streptomyces violaceorubidus]|uniref:Uncharacterized protein n=1 Tax=Streptomyces violaceorubidus TaxID=284042 RepID=A0ABV1T052_9ACTN